MPEHKPVNSATVSDPDNWTREHGDYLYRYALKRMRDSGVAEDAVQETFLAALRARDKFAGQSTERTWFVGILKNKIIDHFRKVSREVDLESENLAETDTDDNFQFDGPQAGMWDPAKRPAEWMVDLGDRAERDEFWQFLHRCLDGLDQRAALVFVLREMEELTSVDICNTLRLQPTNLRVMLYRARRALRKCLEGKWLERLETE